MVLKRMKRRHAREDAIAFCNEAKRLRPEMVFGADIIAGFPTETDEMFENSLRLVDECDLTWLHVFPYSARPGTPAARMPQVDGTLIKDRAKQLRTAGTTRAASFLQSRIGKTEKVLMETETRGRTEQFAEITLTTPACAGETVRAHVTGTANNFLTGQIVTDEACA